jgi:hypothetical protein
MTDSSLHVAALEYAAQGLEVFPLLPGGKFPAIRSPHPEGSRERFECRATCGRYGHGFYDASADPVVITTWWKACPTFNIGIRPTAGIVVLDVDVRADGDKTLAQLVAKQHAPLPETLTARTATGGQHRWFWAGIDPPYNKQLCGGVDLKHRTGYVVAPPSYRRDVRDHYTWTNSIDPVYAPVWLRLLLVKARQSQVRYVGPLAARGRGKGLIRAVRNGTESNRNHLLNWAAYHAACDGLLESICDDLVAAARAVGLDEREIQPTIESAIAAAQKGR